jgi:hypothetical protein
MPPLGSLRRRVRPTAWPTNPADSAHRSVDLGVVVAFTRLSSVLLQPQVQDREELDEGRRRSVDTGLDPAILDSSVSNGDRSRTPPAAQPASSAPSAAAACVKRAVSGCPLASSAPLPAARLRQARRQRLPACVKRAVSGCPLASSAPPPAARAPSSAPPPAARAPSSAAPPAACVVRGATGCLRRARRSCRSSG